jgi:hypothetical protein
LDEFREWDVGFFRRARFLLRKAKELKKQALAFAESRRLPAILASGLDDTPENETP